MAKERFHLSCVFYLPHTLFNPISPVFLVVQKSENRKCDWEEKEVEKASEVVSAEVKQYTMNAIIQTQNGFYLFLRQ